MTSGNLWTALVDRTRSAIACGALHGIETEQHVIEEAGIRYLVRAVPALARKDRARREQTRATQDSGRPANPFLPYEPELFVADVSDTHVALLNKYNVIDHHLLIVTRAFAHQETLLDRSDLQALCTCLAEFEGLGFYNGGAEAGASQPHKHLQLIPLPMAAGESAVPIAPLLVPSGPAETIETLPALPFAHAFLRLPPTFGEQPRAEADRAHRHYHSLLGALGLEPPQGRDAPRQAAPYNLLLTREWMLLVPRTREHFHSISINALGFAGSLFVRGPEQLGLIEAHGPGAVLRAVTTP